MKEIQKNTAPASQSRNSPGRVLGVQCGERHGGSRDIFPLTRGFFQCAGCGAMLTAAQVAAAIPCDSPAQAPVRQRRAESEAE
jgi:hypothetical protein